MVESVGLKISPAQNGSRFNYPVRQGIFLSESTFSADCLTVFGRPDITVMVDWA